MDPTEPNVAHLLKKGIAAAQAGDKAQAHEILTRVTEQDPTQESAWLWLAGVAESTEDTKTYLQTVLAINPHNRQAQKGLKWLLSKTGEQMPGAGLEIADFSQFSAAPNDFMPAGELTPSFVLTTEQAERIDECLARMAYESEAKCIILADMTGQLISERGQLEEMHTQVLSALAAGELAATNEMARLVGEKARFKLMLHEGERNSVYLSDVGEQLILVIVFQVGTPIGLVRMILKQAVDELAPILVEAREAGVSRESINNTLDGDFAKLLESELDSSLEFGGD
ncbi:MAG: roadblock/LC7 domain-containing protein [Anaerolineae bacterium]|nr:roadblock/LC7 domain-containing protein [Anaerolineae bacterium]